MARSGHLLYLRINRNYWYKNLWTVYRKSSNIANVKLDPEVYAKLADNKISVRGHPGTYKHAPIKLPEKLVTTIKTVTADEAPKTLEDQAVGFCKYLYARKQPADDQELQLHSREMSIELQHERGDISNFSIDEQESEMETRRSIIKKWLQKHIYNWKPTEYDHFKSLLYLVGRMAPDHATLSKIFTEIKRDDPTFEPNTMLDFGSGVGSAIWAAQSVFGEVFREYYAVDSSEEMNTLSQRLLQDGDKTKATSIKGLFYRQFLPSSYVVKFDLVVSAYSLLELPSIEMRLQTLDSLWHKTKDYLVLVEYGNFEGYKTIMEARDFLLQIDENNTTKEHDIHVVAPCPHDKSCPLFSAVKKTPCRFQVPYQRLVLRGVNNDITKESFSYVIFKKQPRTSVSWPRIVQPVLPRGKHVICRLCTSKGTLDEYIFTKAKTEKHLYKLSRCLKLGDRLPVNITEDSVKDSTQEVCQQNLNDDKTSEAPIQ